MDMGMNTAIKNAACNLPEGWIINIGIEKGSGWVTITDIDGEENLIDSDATLAEQVQEATDFAEKMELAG